MRQGFYERNHCEILQGNAHFVDEHTLALEVTTVRLKPSPLKICYRLWFLPVSSGRRGFSHPRIYDSDSILSLHHEPAM